MFATVFGEASIDSHNSCLRRARVEFVRAYRCIHHGDKTRIVRYVIEDHISSRSFIMSWLHKRSAFIFHH
jgi:hypothetical protein